MFRLLERFGSCHLLCRTLDVAMVLVIAVVTTAAMQFSVVVNVVIFKESGRFVCCRVCPKIFGHAQFMVVDKNHGSLFNVITYILKQYKNRLSLSNDNETQQILTLFVLPKAHSFLSVVLMHIV